MSRRPFVAGNWKMHTSRASAIELATAVSRQLPSTVDVGVAPPFVYIDAVIQATRGTGLLVGAQDVYLEGSGAFTGEVSTDMLRDLGASFAIVGHSERRHTLGESAALLKAKARAVLNSGLTLIHCVGEKIEQRDAGQTLAVVEDQLAELPESISDATRLVIAYEPVWAIGTGRNATDDQAQEVHAFIRDVLASRYDKMFAYDVRIQYGGSMKPENSLSLLKRNDVDGGLIGGASLKPDSFLSIVRSAVEAKAG